MKFLLRLFNKLIDKIVSLLLRPIEATKPRIYMRLYKKILEKKGIEFCGTPQFISSSAHFDLSATITIGERCVITQDCYFLTHDFSCTTGLIAINETPITDNYITGKIEVGKNVFIGMRSLILPNTTIGNNVIIGAGSVVKGVINSNSVYAGNPAKYICSIEEYIVRQKIKVKNSFHTV